MSLPRVRSPYLSPSLLVRQAATALYYARLSGWRRWASWLLGGRRTIPMAAGAVGMGCIGFPNHPVWEVTADCNLRCQHCHAFSGQPMPDELDTAEGFSVLNGLARIPEFRMVVFTGGEPLVRPDILDLIAHARHLGFPSVIATNATLIDRSLATEMVSLGVAGVAVSLDAASAHIHDGIRGVDGAFDRAIAGIEAARAQGLSIQVNITAMKENMEHIPQALDMADELGADIVLLYQLVPVGRGDDMRDSALSPDENRTLMETVRESQRRLRAVVEPVAAPQVWPMLLGHDAKSANGPGWLARTCFHGCTAGRGLLYLKPDGEVWGCPFLPLSAGNVRHTPVEDIWNGAGFFLSLREDDLKGMCGDCNHASVCRGCRGRAYALTGDYLAEDPSCFMAGNDLSRVGDQP